MEQPKKYSGIPATKIESQLHTAKPIHKPAGNHAETDGDTNRKYVRRSFRIRQDFLSPDYSRGVYPSFILALFIFQELGNTLSPSILIWRVARDLNRIKRSRLYRILPEWLVGKNSFG
jgi:hypothetical protein